MKIHSRSLRATFLLAVLTLFFGISFASPSFADTDNGGYVRLGNLSETLTPVDIYVVPSSGTTTVKHDIGYGTVLSPLDLPAGKYTVDIRDAGAAASSTPAASVVVSVQAGRFYTVAPIDVTGQGNQRRVVDLPDAASTPAGDASVQAINAAVQHGPITFNCSYEPGADGNILTGAPAGKAATASDVKAGNWTMTASGPHGTTSMKVSVAANTDRTEIILDTVSGVQILNLLDMVGDQPAKGEIVTGFGPPPGPGSPLPWLALIGAGALLVAGGGLWLAGARPRKPTPQG
jgi:Domain of unknown function (DUF4397)